MRWMLMSCVAVCAACTSVGSPQPPASPEVAYAIPNPQRPGAKAPSCPKSGETLDGCTFHVVSMALSQARLSASPDATWTATAADAGKVNIAKAADATTPDGTQYQVFEFVPSTREDIDTIITFDKLAGSPGALKVVERRRVTVMIHAP